VVEVNDQWRAPVLVIGDQRSKNANVFGGIRLFSFTKNGCDCARTAATVEDCNYKERLLVRCIGDEIVACSLKTNWPRSEISPPMALVWKRDKPANSVNYVFSDAPSGKRVIVGDKIPNFRDVRSGARVKVKTPV
jgi:hypothetical protein